MLGAVIPVLLFCRLPFDSQTRYYSLAGRAWEAWSTGNQPASQCLIIGQAHENQLILAWLAAAFIGGLVLGADLPINAVWAIALATGLCLLGLVYRHSRWRLVLLLAAATSLGLARSQHPSVAPSSGQLAYYNGKSVSLKGTVSAEPDVRDKGILYEIDMGSVTYRGRVEKASGKVELRTPRSQVLDYGDEVSLQGRLVEPRNTSALPYKDILARRGIGSEMNFPRVVDLGPTSTGWLGWIVPLRQHMESGINEWLPEPEAALLIAITLGAHSASLGDLTNDLIATGLIHIIAISGIKVAIVAGTLLVLVGRVGGRLLSLLLPLSALWLYVLLTGATAAGQRSALMWSVYFLAVFLGRESVSLVSLTLAVALMVAINPDLPWDIGFEMTVFGTAAIIVFTPWLLRRFAYLPSPLRESFAVTLAAQIGTLPIVILGFHVVSGISPIANALVLPLLPVLIVLGFILGLCGGIAQVAAPVSELSYALLHALVALSHLLVRLPGTIPASTISPLGIVIYYSLLTAITWRILRKTGFAPLKTYRPRGRDAIAALALGAALLSTSVSLSSSRGSRLYQLGSGQSKVVQSDGHFALIDGSPNPFALLERLSSVLTNNRRVIDAVLLTNPSGANVTGLNEVLNHYQVLEVVDVGSEHPTTTYSRWRTTLQTRQIPTFALRTNESLTLGSVQIKSLGPDALCPLPNDCAGLLRVASRKRSFLLIGTASPREQLEAVFRPVHLQSDNLLTDSVKPALPAFLKAVNSRLFIRPALASAGSSNSNSTSPLRSWNL